MDWHGKEVFFNYQRGAHKKVAPKPHTFAPCCWTASLQPASNTLIFCQPSGEPRKIQAVTVAIDVTVACTGDAVLSTVKVVIDGRDSEAVDKTVIVGTGAVTVTGPLD